MKLLIEKCQVVPADGICYNMSNTNNIFIPASSLLMPNVAGSISSIAVNDIIGSVDRVMTGRAIASSVLVTSLFDGGEVGDDDEDRRDAEKGVAYQSS
jgi:hypothetical protein